MEQYDSSSSLRGLTYKMQMSEQLTYEVYFLENLDIVKGSIFSTDTYESYINTLSSYGVAIKNNKTLMHNEKDYVILESL